MLHTVCKMTKSREYVKKTNIKRRQIATKAKKTISNKNEEQANLSENKLYPVDSHSSEPDSKKRKSGSDQPEVRKEVSIKPGTILILLTGKHRGKRVVYLKQMKSSGMLLITGPFGINGVPLRRFHIKNTIKTSTEVSSDRCHMTIPSFVDDGYLSKPLDEDRKRVQRQIDEPIIAEIKAVPFLKNYLQQKFTLTKGQNVHQMNF